MSDSSDDMEMYSGFCEDYHECDVRYFLQKIKAASIEDFNDQNHMINYMKKMARIALDHLDEEGS